MASPQGLSFLSDGGGGEGSGISASGSTSAPSRSWRLQTGASEAARSADAQISLVSISLELGRIVLCEEGHEWGVRGVDREGGGVQHVELKANANGEFVAVTVITNLKDGEKGVAVRFTSSNGILKLAKAGHLMAGRRVHITGSISEFKNAYTNADGVIVPLSRPQIQLQAVQLMLGAKPRSAVNAD